MVVVDFVAAVAAAACPRARLKEPQKKKAAVEDPPAHEGLDAEFASDHGAKVTQQEKGSLNKKKGVKGGSQPGKKKTIKAAPMTKKSKIGGWKPCYVCSKKPEDAGRVTLVSAG